MKANDISERLKSESETKRLESQGVNVNALKKDLEKKKKNTVTK